MCDINAGSILEKMESLSRKIERIKANLEAAQREHDALGTTMSIFTPAEPKRSKRHLDLDITADTLRGKSLDDALMIIAEHNNGVVPSTPARELLVEAGVLQGNYARNTLWAALDRSDRFERESKGRYRLVDDDESVDKILPMRRQG